jgi:hypothetical protein
MADVQDVIARRHSALQLAMDYMRTTGRTEEKQLIEVAKRFDHFLETGSNARDRTLAEDERDP